MMHSDSIDQIASALAKAQGAMKAATKDAANPHLNSKYATLAAVVEAIREPLAKHGLSIVQPIMETDEGPILVTMLLHESGQWLSSELKIRAGDGNRGITQVQALGSAITYTRRYALSALLSIPVEDDDGASADGQPQQRKPQPAKAAKPESKSEQPQAEQAESQPGWTNLDDFLYQLHIDFALSRDDALQTLKVLGYKGFPKNGGAKAKSMEMYEAVKKFVTDAKTEAAA